MEICPAFDYKVYRFLGQQLDVVVNECFHVFYLNILVNHSSSGFRCMYSWKFNECIRLVFGTTDGQRCVESIQPRMIITVILEDGGLFQMEGIRLGI